MKANTNKHMTSLSMTSHCHSSTLGVRHCVEGQVIKEKMYGNYQPKTIPEGIPFTPWASESAIK